MFWFFLIVVAILLLVVVGGVIGRYIDGQMAQYNPTSPARKWLPWALGGCPALSVVALGGIAIVNLLLDDVAEEVQAQAAYSIAVAMFGEPQPGSYAGEDQHRDPIPTVGMPTPTPAPPSRYHLRGFLAPAANGGVNIATAGDTIPIRWRLLDTNGNPVNDPASFVRIRTANGGDCLSTGDRAPRDYPGIDAPPGLMFLGDGEWQFNWQTWESDRGTCRRITIIFADGLERSLVFNFKH